MDEPASEPREPEAPEPDYAELLSRLADETRRLGRDLGELAEIGVDRFRLRLRDGAFRLIAGAWLALVAATVTVLAAFFAIDGLAGLLASALGHRAWAGRLAAGVLVLGAVAAGTGLVRARTRREALRRLHRKYDRGERP